MRLQKLFLIELVKTIKMFLLILKNLQFTQRLMGLLSSFANYIPFKLTIDFNE